MGLDQADHCGNKADRADQHQGPGNGPGKTEKAATVNKLTVRERVSRQTDTVIELNMPEMNRAEHWADQELTGSRGDSLKDRLCPTKTGPVVRYVGIHAINNKEPPLPSCTPGTAAMRDQAEQPEKCQDGVEPYGNKWYRAEHLQGPGNSHGMTKKAATVDKLTVREREYLVSEQTNPAIELNRKEMNMDQAEHYEVEQAKQLPGPGNGLGMTLKAATVDKLTVRERVNKVIEQTDTNPVIELALPEMNMDRAEHCERERAEQSVGAANVHKSTVRERANDGSGLLVESALPTIAEKQVQLNEELQRAGEFDG